MGGKLPRPAAATQPVVKRGALGAATPLVPADHRVSLARGPHGTRQRGGCPRLCPPDRARRLRGCVGQRLEPAGRRGPQDRAGALCRGHVNVHARGDDGDGKALQMGTSHELGQNFARAFGIDYLAASGRRELAWTTSWGITTRLIGGLIMAHGDDLGLRIPPRVAPVQAHVLVVKEGDGVVETARKLTDGLRDAGVRATLDERVDVPFGRRAIDAELKGYPVRIEVGPRDIVEGRVVVVRRVTGERIAVPIDG